MAAEFASPCLPDWQLSPAMLDLFEDKKLNVNCRSIKKVSALSGKRLQSSKAKEVDKWEEIDSMRKALYESLFGLGDDSQNDINEVMKEMKSACESSGEEELYSDDSTDRTVKKKSKALQSQDAVSDSHINDEIESPNCEDDYNIDDKHLKGCEFDGSDGGSDESCDDNDENENDTLNDEAMEKEKRRTVGRKQKNTQTLCSPNQNTAFDGGYATSFHAPQHLSISDKTIAQLKQDVPMHLKTATTKSAGIDSAYHRFCESVRNLPTTHAAEKKKLLESYYLRNFKQWKLNLLNGFNLLLCGFGSKKQLLDVFAFKSLMDGPCLVIRGYAKRVWLQTAITQLLQHAYSTKLSPNVSIEELFQTLKRKTNESGAPLYILVHNIDGAALRNKQKSLAYLAALPNVKMIASVDHLRFGLLWDSSDKLAFNFKIERSPTYEDYRTEILSHWSTSPPQWMGFNKAKRGTKGGNLGAVMQNLTKRHMQLTQLVAGEQLNGFSDGELTQDKLLQMAKQEMIAADRTLLKDLLKELFDHNVFVVRSGTKAKQVIYMPHSNAELEAFVQE